MAFWLKTKYKHNPGLILPLEMGATIGKNKIFILCGHQQKEPDELRGSRPVPREGGGAIPLPDLISGNATSDRKHDCKSIDSKTFLAIFVLTKK